jgi:hypothetical protein
MPKKSRNWHKLRSSWKREPGGASGQNREEAGNDHNTLYPQRRLGSIGRDGSLTLGGGMSTVRAFRKDSAQIT